MRDYYADFYAHLAALDPRILRLYGYSLSPPLARPGFDLREPEPQLRNIFGSPRRDALARAFHEAESKRPEPDPEILLRRRLRVHYFEEHDAHVRRWRTRHYDYHRQHDEHVKARKHYVWERHWKVQQQMEAHAWDHSTEDLAEDFFPLEAEGRVYGEAEYIYSHRDAVDGHRWHNLRF